MADCLILSRSLTTAQRFVRCLEQCGLSGRVVRAPGKLTGNGCGYAVAVPYRLLQESMVCLRKRGLRPGKAVMLDNDQPREWLP